MPIYKDIFTGDDLVDTNMFSITEIDGVVYEIDCAEVDRASLKADTGPNPQAEDDEDIEANDGDTDKTFNIAEEFGYHAFAPTKSRYTSLLKTYLKKIQKNMSENGASEGDMQAFGRGAAAYTKNILANFENYQFFLGSEVDPDAMVIPLRYREDGVTPYIVLWKHGLKEAS